MPCLKAYIKQKPFFLAPMAGVTDKPFRSFMREMGCGLITSELISARALKDGNQKSLRLTEFSEDQRPYGIQIFGEDPCTIAEGAKKAEQLGPDFIDLNLGCPVNKIVKKGAGSALLKDLKALAKVLRALRAAVEIPLSLKIRTGWSDGDRNADQTAEIAYGEGFSWMSIHGRTRAQGYSGRADWNYIKEISSKSSIPIVGNGDLTSGRKAFEALKLSGCAAVMIGRGCLNDPWIFFDASDFLKREENSRPAAQGSLKEIGLKLDQKNSIKAPVFKKDLKEALDRLRNHLESFYDERMFLLQLKKFAAWFSSGLPRAAEFRRDLFQEKDKEALIQKIDEFFYSARGYEKPEPKYEPFLMKGHG